jgi:hypothetical protein
LVDRPTAFGLALIIGLGLVSSALAHQPLWAFTEVAVFVGCGAIATAFAVLRRNGGEPLDRVLVGVVVVLCLIKSTQYLYAGALAFASGERMLDPDLLSGFSNKRFYGQFQTFTLPLLALSLIVAPCLPSCGGGICVAVCLVADRDQRRHAVRGLAWAWQAACWRYWGPGGDAGSDGNWWHVLVACCCIGWRLQPWRVTWGSRSPTVPVSASPPLSGAARSGCRLGMLVERPWLGFGPMQFADIANSVAAHPHQAILQWASEWGVPSALCVALLAWRGGWATWSVLRQRAQAGERADLLRLCLFAALVGALVQSMVDGVIVMPNSQVWLALVVGWLLALHVAICADRGRGDGRHGKP